jgi:hypothetical protein
LSKKSLVFFHGLSVFFCSSESFKKFGLPPEKKTGGKLWAGPPILVAAAVAVAVVAAAALGIIVAS